MKFAVFATLSLLASFANAFHIVPPSGLTTCSSVTIGYDTSTGQAPFNLVFHTGNADGPVVAAFTDIIGSSFTWDQVAIASGTQIVIVLGDSSGKGSGTPAITVAQGSSTDCVGTPTSIPTLLAVTSSSSPTSSYDGVTSSSSSSEPSQGPVLSSANPILSSLPPLTNTVTNTPTSTVTDTSTTTASPILSSLTTSTSTVTNTSTSTTTDTSASNGGLTNPGVFMVGAISAVIGALLA